MISTVNEFSAVLDTCVLLPISLCDLLLRLAEEPAMYVPRWSQSILVELESKLASPKFNLSVEKAAYRIACMKSAFPEAMVEGSHLIENSMTNHVDDRHVLAAAVLGGVQAIVTANLRDFPAKCLDPFGIEPLSPDTFLIRQWNLDSKLVANKLEAQVGDIKIDMRAHLKLLSRMVPEFSKAVINSLS